MSISAELEQAHLDAQYRMGQLNGYYQWIINNFRPYFGIRIWDAGAGVGHVSTMLIPHSQFLLVTEYTPENIRILHERFDANDAVQVKKCDLIDATASRFERYQLDTIVNLDVIEHLRADMPALQAFYRNLVPGGHLLLKVPAHPFLFGTMDEASLHFRRYSKQMLKSRLEQAGFKIRLLRPMNMAAVVPYFIKGRILKRKGIFSRQINASRLGLYNRLMPVLEACERVLPMFFGLSLIAVAMKPEQSQ